MQKIATMKYNSDSDECTADEAFDTKGIILKYIDKVPNIRHRELLRLSGLSNGMLEYHLKIMKTNKVTVEIHDGRRTRYYPIYIPTDTGIYQK